MTREFFRRLRRSAACVAIGAFLLPACESEPPPPPPGPSNAELLAQLETQAAKIDALREKVEQLERRPQIPESPPPPGPPPTPRTPLDPALERRMNEVGVRMLEKMEKNGTLDRASEVGVDALETMLEQAKEQAKKK